MLRQSMTLVLALTLAVTSPAFAQNGQLGIEVSQHQHGGLEVRRVLAGTPAEMLGLKEGYRILAIGSEPVRSSDQFIERIRRIRPGTWETLDVAAHGILVRGFVTTHDRTMIGNGQKYVLPQRGVLDIGMEDQRRHVIGARVAAVEVNGAGWRGGLRRGDVIVEVNGIRTETTQAVLVAIANHAGREVSLTLVRNKQVVSQRVKPEAVEDTGRLTVPAALASSQTTGDQSWCDENGVRTVACVTAAIIVGGVILALLRDDTGMPGTKPTNAEREAAKARERQARRAFEQAIDDQARREGRLPN